jgi:hypothetical protein
LSQRFLLRQCLSCSLLPFGLELRILNASRLLTRSLLPLCILLGRNLSLSHLPLCLLLGRYLLLSSLSLRLLLGHRLSCSLLPFDLESRILEVSRLVTDGILLRGFLTLIRRRESFLPSQVDHFLRCVLFNSRRHRPCDVLTPIQSNHIGRWNGRQCRVI